MNVNEAKQLLHRTPASKQREVFINHGMSWDSGQVSILEKWALARHRNGSSNAELYALATRFGRRATACLEALRKFRQTEVSERRWNAAYVRDAELVQFAFPASAPEPIYEDKTGQRKESCLGSPFTAQLGSLMKQHGLYDVPPDEEIVWLKTNPPLPSYGQVRLLLNDGTVTEPIAAEYVQWTNLIAGFTVIPTPKRKGFNTMDLNVATLVSEGARTVVVQFFNNPQKAFTYVTDLDLAQEDIVIVPASGALSIAKVIQVHDDLQIEPNSEIKYKWVAGKFDPAYYEANELRLAAIESKLSEAYKKNIKRSFAAQVLAGLDDGARDEILALTNSKS